MGLVYHAFDTTNGKSYVGQTWGMMEERKKEHSGNPASHPFVNALRKRPDAFVWTILTTCETQADLDAAELYFGHFFDCLVPNGYCLKLGMGRGRVSEETKRKMSIAQRNKSDITRAKLSMSLRGNTNGASNKGRKLTPEQKAVITQRTSAAIKLWWAQRKGV